MTARGGVVLVCQDETLTNRALGPVYSEARLATLREQAEALDWIVLAEASVTSAAEMGRIAAGSAGVA
jgi:hypothetical protein